MKISRPILLILLVITIIASCSKKDTRISRFENILGEPESSYLNEIINDFETYLESRYKEDGKVSRYKQYLQEMSKSSISKFWRIDSLKLKKYRQSRLFAKYDSIYPDSVWWEYDMLHMKQKYSEFEVEESIIPISGKDIELNIDSLILAMQKEPTKRLVENSPFFVALDSVSKGSILIESYLETIDLVGTVSPHILINALLYHYSDSTEYFSKRILLMDLYHVF